MVETATPLLQLVYSVFYVFVFIEGFAGFLRRNCLSRIRIFSRFPTTVRAFRENTSPSISSLCSRLAYAELACVTTALFII